MNSGLQNTVVRQSCLKENTQSLREVFVMDMFIRKLRIAMIHDTGKLDVWGWIYTLPVHF